MAQHHGPNNFLNSSKYPVYVRLQPGACRDTAQWTSGPRCFPGAASPGRARPVGLTTGRRRAARRRPRSAGSAASGPSLRRPPPSSAGPSRRSRRAARCTRWVIAAAGRSAPDRAGAARPDIGGRRRGGPHVRRTGGRHSRVHVSPGRGVRPDALRAIGDGR